MNDYFFGTLEPFSLGFFQDVFLEKIFVEKNNYRGREATWRVLEASNLEGFGAAKIVGQVYTSENLHGTQKLGGL